jgi:hypothetical protein
MGLSRCRNSQGNSGSAIGALIKINGCAVEPNRSGKRSAAVPHEQGTTFRPQVECHFSFVHLFLRGYVDACCPGARNHWLACAALSACCAFRNKASRAAPGRSSLASSRQRLASAIRRFSSDLNFLSRRGCVCMALFPCRRGGSAIGLSVTDKSREPGGDAQL